MSGKQSVTNLCIILTFIVIATLGCNQSSGTENTINTTNSGNTTTSNTSGASTSSAKDISGSYSVTGTNEGGGGNYSGDLMVTKRDEVYQFSWSSGARNYDGVGVQTDNTVAVSFTEGTDGKGCGVVLYKIGSDGSLDGKVGFWGVNQSETEKGTRTSGSDLDGVYNVTGSNPNGSSYKGKLTVKKAGVGYNFVWDTGSTINGFGVRNGDKVAVGFGGSQCGFVSYDLKPGGTLDGKWGGQGSTAVGTEVAKKK